MRIRNVDENDNSRFCFSQYCPWHYDISTRLFMYSSFSWVYWTLRTVPSHSRSSILIRLTLYCFTYTVFPNFRHFFFFLQRLPNAFLVYSKDFTELFPHVPKDFGFSPNMSPAQPQSLALLITFQYVRITFQVLYTYIYIFLFFFSTLQLRVYIFDRVYKPFAEVFFQWKRNRFFFPRAAEFQLRRRTQLTVSSTFD